MQGKGEAVQLLSARGRGGGRRLAFLIPIGILLGAATGQDRQLDPGPDPTWERAVPLSEAALRSNLIDPQSAQIEWPYNFISGSMKALLGKRRAGWYTCGWVNAKNRMGGYTGRVWFLVMINSGVVTELDIGSADGIDPASATCPDLVKRGSLPAAPAPVPTSTLTGTGAVPVTQEAFVATANKSAGEAAARGGIGIAYQATPYGAFVAAVAPGSPAEKAGLKPGEVIESVNGIAIKGLDQPTIGKIFAGADAKIVLTIVGVGQVKVTR